MSSAVSRVEVFFVGEKSPSISSRFFFVVVIVLYFV